MRISIEDKFYNHLGWREKVEKTFFNLEFLGKYEFDDDANDIIFGTFEKKWFFGSKKYFFLDWGDKQNHVSITDWLVELWNELPIPYIIMDKNDWDTYDKIINSIESIIENINNSIKQIDILNWIIEEENNISLISISYWTIHSYREQYDMKPDSFIYNEPEVILFFKETWEKKTFPLSFIIEQYS